MTGETYNPVVAVATLMKTIPAEYHKAINDIIGITFEAAQRELVQRMAERTIAGKAN